MSEHEEDFASLFEASSKAQQVKRGQTVEGMLVAIGAKVALVDIGGKGEAELDVNELKDEDGDIDASVGDRIAAMVISTSGGIVLSRKGVRNAATHREIEDAFQNGMAVEGKVAQAVKGGYEVRIARERAFCPQSQIDTARTADPAAHVGKVYPFLVVEYKNGGKDIVLSRRKLLERQQQAEADTVRRSIVPDAVLKGRVASVLDFGAFVDFGGGIQGLLHVSEMSWSRISSPSAIVAPGDAITVKVLRVDEATGKISLGLKQLQGDPWAAVAATYAAGQVCRGTISRIAEFGAFVELEPGVEGLAHASTFPPTGRAGEWAKSIAVGQAVTVEVLTIDLAQKRIGLALVDEASSRAASAVPAADGISVGAIITGKIERHERFGVFVFLAPGKTALMPLSETGLDRDADPRKTFPVGSDVEVVVLDVDPGGRRTRVSRKAVAEQRERAEVQDYTSRQQSQSTASIGSLADKLRGALKGR